MKIVRRGGRPLALAALVLTLGLTTGACGLPERTSPDAEAPAEPSTGSSTELVIQQDDLDALATALEDEGTLGDDVSAEMAADPE